jgi:hypothetical protein
LSAPIADFNIRFNTETAKFQKDVDYAKKMLRGYTTEAKAANDSNLSLGRSLEQTADRAKSAGRGVLDAAGYVSAGIGAVTGATAYLITQQAQQAREVEKMATVAQVSVQQIQALAYASEQYNISGESMADILKDVNDKLGDFAENEGGEFADFMTNIAPTVGLTIDQLQKLSGPEALVAVKAAMDEANVPMKSQIFYLESIANDASALMPLLDNQGRKLYELTKKYDDLNVSMSEYDIEKFKEMDQKLTDVGLKIQRSFANAVLGASDQIDWFSDKLAYSINYWGTLFDSWSDTPRTVDGLSKKISELQSERKQLSAELKEVNTTFKEYEGIDADSLLPLNPFGRSENELFNLNSDFGRLTKQIDDLDAEIARQQKRYNIMRVGMNYDKPQPGLKTEDDTSDRIIPEDPNAVANQQASGASRLASLDMQYADEREKLLLAHEQRVTDIENLKLSEQEIERRGFDSLEAIKAEYTTRENAHYENEKAKHQERVENEINQVVSGWQQRLALNAAGEETAATEEALAYVNRQKLLDEQFAATMEKAAGNKALEQELENQYFATREATWEQHQRNLNKIEEDAAKSRRAKQIVELSNYSDLFGNMAGLVKGFSGKQSGLYRGMFAASKAFAVAESIIKIQQGIANAASLPFPSNIPAMGSVIASTASIVNTIKSTQMGNMAHNGISEVPMLGGRTESDWTLKAGERVYTNQSANQIDQMYSAIMAMQSQRFALNDPSMPNQNRMAANGGVASAQPWVIHIHEAEPGTSAEIDDEAKVIRIMMKDAQSGGQYYGYISQTLGVKPGGFK